MLSTSLIPNSIKSQYSELEKAQYWQNLGDDQNIALFCSIIHYFLNQKNFRPILRFLNITDKCQKAEFSQLHKIIIQSLEAINPIQQFFDYVSQKQRNISEIGQFFVELCRIHLLKKQDKPNLNGLALFFQTKIIFLHNKKKYGSGQNEILILQKSNSFYFILPSPQFRNQPQQECNICNQIENCFKMNCLHYLCLKCIQFSKQNSQNEYFLCNCDQIILKNKFLEDAIEEIKNNQVINNYITSINKYYESILVEDQLKEEQEIVNDPVQMEEISNDKVRNQVNRQNNQYELLKSDGYLANDLQNRQYSSQQNNSNDWDVIIKQKPEKQNQQTNDHFQEEPSKSFNLISGIENLAFEPSQQFKEYSQCFYISDKCTYCHTCFDDYNIKQDISCSLHQIGACCIYAIYQQCPQCENIIEKLNSYKFTKFTPEIRNVNELIDQNKKYPGQENNRQSLTNPTMEEIYGKTNFEMNHGTLIINQSDDFYLTMNIKNQQIQKDFNQQHK
ncbi:unnamed protein product [Paramecium sonneborni]|uniref:RING-type domain-containing protein n=1 Tax=Paramecium sonneborni TaxID=65129 RepID=A0A8S1RFD1_9CILI|nr:unnamed protein product [Paramecium sonneborni]